MTLEPHRTKCNNTTLRDLLQSATARIRKYLTTLSDETPKLIVHTNQLWELSQRQRLVAGNDEASSTALLSACNAVYQLIYNILRDLRETLEEIADHVEDFERESSALKEEEQLESNAEWNAWLFQTLNVLQTHSKYLEIHARSLTPSLVQCSTVKQFKKDLQLVKLYEANFYMGFARAAA